MSDIDAKIRGALDEEDKEFLDRLEGDRGIFRQFGDSFHGPLKGWVIAVNIVVLIVTGLGFYAIWGFVNADNTDALIRWAALGWVAWTLQIGLKQWQWDRINMLNILREVKRLELQVALLSEKAD